MIIVSGCPRSGTSLMMDCLRLALGEDRILGEKFPQEGKRDRKDAETEAEEPALLAINEYLKQKRKTLETGGKDLKEFRDMNPNGFWECRYTVRGVVWHMGIEDICQAEKVCKVVSQGLTNTNPQFVDKMIFMIRHPREVAKSQERLVRGGSRVIDRGIKKLGKVHTPEMFINVTISAAMWLQQYPQTNVLFVNHADLLADPDAELERVKTFLGEGDFIGHPVEKNLHRSKPEEIEHELWAEAEKIYDLFCAADFAGIVEYAKDARRAASRLQVRFKCPRMAETVSYAQCRVCATDKTTAENFKIKAINNEVDWRKEPCLFECGINLDGEQKTIEESIATNTWVEGADRSRGAGDTIARLLKSVGWDGDDCPGCIKRRRWLNELFPYKGE